MGFYPQDTTRDRSAQTEIEGLCTQALLPVIATFDAAGCIAADDDYFVASVDMKVGAYTLAKTAMPGNVARNITVTQTATGTEDTNGTIVVAGTDLDGTAITETLTPNDGAVVAGAKAFLTVTSITGAGWVIDAVEGKKDKVKVGFGDLIGLPNKLDVDTTVCAYLDGVREALAAVTVSDTDLASNTIDLTSALNGHEVKVLYAA